MTHTVINVRRIKAGDDFGCKVKTSTQNSGEKFRL